MDFDAYEASNANRQICCYADSLGRPKAEAVAAAVGAIPGGPELRPIVARASLESLEAELPGFDFVVAAADDYAFSLSLLDAAQDSGVAGGLALPIGFWAGVALVEPRGLRASRLFGIRPGSEAAYRGAIERGLPGLARMARRKGGSPMTAEYGRYLSSLKAPPQACPIVWAAASLLSLGIMRHLGGLGGVRFAPHWQELTSRGMRNRYSWGAAILGLGDGRG
jgi:hypothetical protein